MGFFLVYFIIFVQASRNFVKKKADLCICKDYYYYCSTAVGRLASLVVCDRLLGCGEGDILRICEWWGGCVLIGINTALL